MDRKKYQVIATCWIPALDTSEKQHKYTFHNEIYNTEEEAELIANDIMSDHITGEFIDVIIKHIDQS